ncbi:MAG: hypothetical protein KKH52_03240 [Nanoarchaeota archaeon]|nr:hypothetical protein [Nanoarchaeota archaeon]MBU1622376.1 hypothetical protein [Nanoarchaeota archaeon]MBU1974382.1 hypothetical protein [Nanoarchaeota archaeon]
MSKKNLIDLPKLIDMFTLFVLGTIMLTLNHYLVLPDNTLFNHVKTGLAIITFFSYEVVIITLIIHQFARAKNKLVQSFMKDRERYFVLLVLVLGITYLTIVWFNTKNIYSVLQNLILVSLGVIAVPQVNKRLKKWWNKLGKKRQNK